MPVRDSTVGAATIATAVVTASAVIAPELPPRRTSAGPDQLLRRATCAGGHGRDAAARPRAAAAARAARPLARRRRRVGPAPARGPRARVEDPPLGRGRAGRRLV